MASIKSVGFDMDHTLARYHGVEFETLVFRETLKKFIQAGYPEELSQLQFDPKFVIRGLLVDRERGNILKADCHKYVKVAFHGHQKLAKEERHRLYNAESFDPESFLSIDSFFALSEVQLFTEIVDFMRLHPKRIQKSFSTVYGDLRQFIDLSHRDGSIKKHVLADPGKYIINDKSIPEALVRLLDGDKHLFLLTNSQYEYTDAILSYLLDQSHPGFSKWHDYFHHIIVGAGKPGFFTSNQPFFEVLSENGLLKNHSGMLQTDTCYQGGNAGLFQQLTKLKGDEILYCGDHMYVDIIRSKGLFNWRTLIVVEELEEAIDAQHSISLLSPIYEKIREREIHEEDAQRVRSNLRSTRIHLASYEKRSDHKKVSATKRSIETLEKKRRDKETLITQLDEEIRTMINDYEGSIHKHWGGLFQVGLEKSRFAKQLEEYACLYTCRISNLRFYSSSKRFISAHDKLPHDS